jgi:CheY-like chemotaxis protein
MDSRAGRGKGSMDKKIKHILIIDDSPDDRFIARKMLEKKNYIVEEAEGSEEALMKLKKGNVDLILLDLVMPGVDGLELLELIRKTLKVPIVIYSCSSFHDPKECMQKGSNAFVAKYENPAILVSKVEELLLLAA